MGGDGAAQPGLRGAVGGLIVLSLWGLLAPYVGPSLGLTVTTRAVVEVVDHVLPAVAVLGTAVWVWRSGRLEGVALAIVGLSGLWMTSTHAPLVVQALGPGAEMSAALFHSVPGALLLLGAVTAAVWQAGASKAGASKGGASKAGTPKAGSG